METLVLWLGFIGSWLLFAGPIYQAALELQDEDIQIDRIRAAGAKVQPPKHSSVWWWLLPPVKIYQEYRRKRQYQQRYLKVLAHDDIEAMVSYRNKASAWLYVSLGGLCIAGKETFELVHHNHGSTIIWLAVVVSLAIISILNMVIQLRHSAAITKS